MEIIQEYDNWRRVRDAEGTEGWINQSLLSGERTAQRRAVDARQGHQDADLCGPVQRPAEERLRRRQAGARRRDAAAINAPATGARRASTAPTAGSHRRNSGAPIRARSSSRPLPAPARRRAAPPSRWAPSAASGPRRQPCGRISALRPQPDHDVDMGDFHAFGRLGQIADADVADRNVEHDVLALDEEMVMVGDVGVEIGPWAPSTARTRSMPASVNWCSVL